MKSRFTDLHLRPPIDQIDKVQILIEKSAELGYDMVGLTFPVDVKMEHVEHIRKTCMDLDLDFVTRVDLTPKNGRELLSALKKIRRKFEVVAVNCQNKEVYIQAAKDRRVDLISSVSGDYKGHFFSASEARLASEKGAALEVSLTPLLYLEGFRRIQLMSVLRRETLAASKFNVPIVLSSGADSPRLLRKPNDYIFLAYLIDLDPHTAELALSTNPRSIVERNRSKMSPNYICPGVYLVKRGEDC
jgi:ribonuclease P/MRP protein subunit RPP1